MAFVVVYDANVLYGNTLRDLLIRIAMTGRVQAKWTNQILDEMQRNLGANRPDIPPEKLGNLRRLMNSAVRDCLIEDYETLIEGLKLPDPDDRHVLAAAIRAGAQVIVTSNLKDFPAEDMLPGGWRRSRRTISFSTRSTSTAGSYGHAFSRLPTHGTTRRKQSRMYSTPWRPRV
jgi:predicted nucleic acid-binding protein